MKGGTMLSILAFAPVDESGNVVDIVKDKDFYNQSFDLYCDEVETIRNNIKTTNKSVESVIMDKGWID